MALCKKPLIRAFCQLAESTLCGWRVFAEVLGASSCRVIWPRRIVWRPGGSYFQQLDLGRRAVGTGTMSIGPAME